MAGEKDDNVNELLGDVKMDSSLDDDLESVDIRHLKVVTAMLNF